MKEKRKKVKNNEIKRGRNEEVSRDNSVSIARLATG
jgi:hypothetical protein